MKKLLALMLLAVFVLSIPACQSASDSPNPPETIDSATTVSTTTQQPTVTTTEPTVTTTEPTVTTTEPTVTTTEPTVTTTEPIVTQPTRPTADSVIDYDGYLPPEQYTFDEFSCDYSPVKIDDLYEYYDDMCNPMNNASMAICLVTVTDIDVPWNIHMKYEETKNIFLGLTPVHVRIDKIYSTSKRFDPQVMDELIVIDMCNWVDQGDGSYTVSYDRALPLTQIGKQYVVYIHPTDFVYGFFTNEEGEREWCEYVGYCVEAMSIPINESIDDEEYRNEWHEKLGLSDLYINMSNRVIEELYKSEENG